MDHHGPAGAVFRPQVLLLALLVQRDHGMGRIENGLRGAVVLVEDYNSGVREIVLEVEDVADIGRTPGVDGLVWVAHDADVAMAGSELLAQHILGDVRVLELVDVHVGVALGVLLQDILSLLEEVDRLDQDIVEIQSLALLEDVLVAEEDPRCLLLEVVRHDRRELARPLQLALGS